MTNNTDKRDFFVNRAFNTHFICYIFNLFVFNLQVDVIGPLLLNASLLLVLTTDYSDSLGILQVTKDTHTRKRVQ